MGNLVDFLVPGLLRAFLDGFIKDVINNKRRYTMKKIFNLLMVLFIVCFMTLPVFALDLGGGLSIVPSTQTVGADATFYTRNSTVNQGNALATGGCSSPFYDLKNTAGVWQADFLAACVLAAAPVDNATNQPSADLLGGIQLINFKGLRFLAYSSMIHGGVGTAFGFSVGGTINQVSSGTLTLPNGQVTH
jgi:hypothetical protein